MGLRHADYRGILLFLGDLGTANDVDGFMTTSVGRLHDLVPAQWISFHDLTFTYPRPFHPEVIDVFAYHEYPSVSEIPDAADIESSCEHANPLCATHDGLPHVRRISDVIDRAAVLARHDFYQELMYPIGREFESKASLPSQPGSCRAFVLSRDGRNFSDRETLILEALLPHLTHAFRNVRDRELTSAIVATLDEVAGVKSLGIVVLGANERIEAFAGRARSSSSPTSDARTAISRSRSPRGCGTSNGELRRRKSGCRPSGSSSRAPKGTSRSGSSRRGGAHGCC